MDDKVGTGCALGCALVIGIFFFSWAMTVGIIWLICFCLGSFGVVFDLGLATAVWLILLLIGGFFGGK